MKDNSPRANHVVKPATSTMNADTRRAQNAGLPSQIKSGVESMTGHNMADVRVQTNSSKPAQLQAHAFTQGNTIHKASGQEKHLPHEAWHVTQQKQGRVKGNTQF